MFKLKPGVESFEVVDGPFAGKKFLRGKTYKDIPPEEKNKFEAVQGSKVQGSKAEGIKAQTSEPRNPEPGTTGGDK